MEPGGVSKVRPEAGQGDNASGDVEEDAEVYDTGTADMEHHRSGEDYFLPPLLPFTFVLTKFDGLVVLVTATAV